MKPSRKLSTTVIALAALVSVSGFAMGPSTVSVRSGMLMGSVSGGEGLQGSLTTIPYLDGEFNIFLTSRSTLLFRSIIALDMATANLNYAYFGSGQRYYIGSSGLGFTRTEGGYTVKKNPGLNYYVGWDLGVSNMVLSKIGSLVVASTAFDSGGTIGLNYALFDGVALNTGASVSYVMGFTSLAVTGLAMKFYVGVTF